MGLTTEGYNRKCWGKVPKTLLNKPRRKNLSMSYEEVVSRQTKKRPTSLMFQGNVVE